MLATVQRCSSGSTLAGTTGSSDRDFVAVAAALTGRWFNECSLSIRERFRTYEATNNNKELQGVLLQFVLRTSLLSSSLLLLIYL